MIRSTIWSHLPAWNDQVDVIDWRDHDLAGFVRAFWRSRPGDVVIVNGALGFGERWRDLITAVATLSWRRGIGVVVSDATWDPRSVRDDSAAGALFTASDRLNRFLVRRLVGPRSVFCFLAEGEVTDFLAEAPGPPGGAVFTPFMFTLPDELTDPDAIVAQERKPFVFSGGNTLRDWTLITEALGGTDVPVRVAARPGNRSWPPNFEVSPVPEAEFFRLAGEAQVGALALRTDVRRSCGQQTYLNLLRLGTPVVVNDAPGVREHLGGVPAATVTPATDPDAFRAAVLAELDGSPDRRAEAARGAAAVDLRFGPGAYLQGLIDLAHELEGRLL